MINPTGESQLGNFLDMDQMTLMVDSLHMRTRKEILLKKLKQVVSK